jgi:probable HAF family extracellular repeat protein
VIHFPGALDTVVNGINEVGQLAGVWGDLTTSHGFVREADGTFHTVDVPGSDSTSAFDINTRGHIVGEFIDATGTHAFLATPSAIPEPSTWLLLGSGIVGLVWWNKWKRPLPT